MVGAYTSTNEWLIKLIKKLINKYKLNFIISNLKFDLNLGKFQIEETIFTTQLEIFYIRWITGWKLNYW